MGKQVTLKDIIRMHVERFGMEPVIEGTRTFDPEPLEGRILQAIEDGQPYIEGRPEENTDY